MSFDTSSGEGAVLADGQSLKEIRGDLRLLSRAVTEEWQIDQERMNRVCDRAFEIAIEYDDPDIALKAKALLLKMREQNLKYRQTSEPLPTQRIEHHHTHELGPVTADNIEQQRAARLARYSSNSG